MAKDSSPVRFSARTEFYIQALIDLGVGKTRSEIIRRFVWDGIERYIDRKLLPVKVVAATDLPDPENADDGEP